MFCWSMSCMSHELHLLYMCKKKDNISINDSGDSLSIETEDCNIFNIREMSTFQGC